MRNILIGLCVSLSWLTRLHAQEPKLVVRAGHGEPVACLAFSPDGKQLLTGHADASSYGSRFRLWDTATGRPLRAFSALLGVRSAAFSPDGKAIIAGGARVEVWDPATGKTLHRVPDEFHGGSTVFSKDGKFVVAVNGAGARVWEIATGKVIGPYGGQVSAAVLSGDGKLLIWADARDVMVVDWAADKVIHKLKHAGWLTALCLSADDKWLVTGCHDRTIRLWDMASGEKLRAFIGHQNLEEENRFPAEGIISLAMSGDVIASAADDKTAIVWDRKSGDLIRRFGFNNPVLCSTLSADGKWLVTADGPKQNEQRQGKRPSESRLKKADPAETFGKGFVGPSVSTVRLWEVATGKLLRTFQRPRNDSSILALSIDGKSLATAGPDETARIWDLAAGKQTTVLGPHNNGVGRLAFGGDGKWLLTEDGDFGIESRGVSRVWNTSTGKIARDFGRTAGSAISARADIVVCATVPEGPGGGSDGLLLFELPDKKPTPINGRYRNPGVSPDGKVIAAVTFNSNIALLDARTGKETGLIEDSVLQSIYDYPAFSHDGKWIIANSLSARTIWDVDAKAILHSFAGAYSVALSGDKKRFAAATRDDSIAVWNLATRKRLSLFTGHTRDVRAIALTQDGKRLFSAGLDSQAIRLIDASTGKELCKLYAFFDGSWAVLDAQGHYDCANNGDSDFLFWVQDGEIQPLARFRAGHYEPGLLKKYLREP